MKRIVHIITGLGSGGAENMLYKFLKYSDKTKYSYVVLSLSDRGVYGRKIEELGIEVHFLNLKSKRLFNASKVTYEICKKADIICTWLYHADLWGFIFGKLLLKKKVIWNVRHSNLSLKANKKLTLLICKINSILSKYVSVVTYNSDEAKLSHLEYGYKEKLSLVIPNGFEVTKFNINRKYSNNEIYSEHIRLLTVGRWNVQKGYEYLFQALKRLKDNNVNYKMLMCGTNLDDKNDELKKMISEYGITDQIDLLGRQTEVEKIYNLADVYISSSIGESFSNSIGEAMLSGLLCIVTDVGASAKIVGENGFVVKPYDSGGLYEAINKIYNCIENVEEKRIESRESVIKRFNIEDVVKIYESTYEKNCEN